MLSSSVVVSSSVVNATVVAAAVVTAAVVAAVVTAVVEAVVEAVGATAEFIETWLGTDILFMFPIFPMDIPLGDITCTGPKAHIDSEEEIQLDSQRTTGCSSRLPFAKTWKAWGRCSRKQVAPVH